VRPSRNANQTFELGSPDSPGSLVYNGIDPWGVGFTMYGHTAVAGSYDSMYLFGNVSAPQPLPGPSGAANVFNGEILVDGSGAYEPQAGDAYLLIQVGPYAPHDYVTYSQQPTWYDPGVKPTFTNVDGEGKPIVGWTGNTPADVKALDINVMDRADGGLAIVLGDLSGPGAEGWTYGNPLLGGSKDFDFDVSGVSGDANINTRGEGNGLGVVGGSWAYFDPPAGTEYDYQIDTSSGTPPLFAGLLLPEELGEGLGTGLSAQIQFDDGSTLQDIELFVGSTLDFLSYKADGIEAFKIVLNDPMADPKIVLNDPMADPFTVGLVFTDAGSVSFAVIPEPGTLLLLSSGAIIMLAVMWRRRRRQA